MDKLALGEEIPAGPMLLYSLIWGPRAACKTFTSWMNVSINEMKLINSNYFKSK